MTPGPALCAEARAAAQRLLDHYVQVQGAAVAQMLRKSVETRDWLGTVEPRNVRAVMKRVVEDITAIDVQVGLPPGLGGLDTPGGLQRVCPRPQCGPLGVPEGFGRVAKTLRDAGWFGGSLEGVLGAEGVVPHTGGAALRGGGEAGAEQRFQPARLLCLQQLAGARPLRPQLHPQVSPATPGSPWHPRAPCVTAWATPAPLGSLSLLRYPLHLPCHPLYDPGLSQYPHTILTALSCPHVPKLS